MYEQIKPVVMLKETSVSAAASTTARIDTLGYKRLTLVLNQSTVAAPSNKLATCKLSEADTTSATATAITQFVGGGSGGFTIPSADSSAAQVYQFNVDLLGHKRYIVLEVSPLATQTFTAVGVLYHAEQNFATAAGEGIAALIEG